MYEYDRVGIGVKDFNFEGSDGEIGIRAENLIGFPVSAQVWSLTQLYSVDFSQSKISCVKKCISTNKQSRFASAVLDNVLRASVPCAANQTV